MAVCKPSQLQRYRSGTEIESTESAYLVQDIRHPSLRAKKYDEAQDIWQARVNQDWRFYFQIEGGTYILLDIMKHPK